MPPKSKVPIQQVLLIDLRNADVPFHTDPPVPYLPLLYPFKYGAGGPSIQYSLVSEAKIQILYMSDPTPDEPEFQYLQVADLPEQPLALRALSYEEARYLAFSRENGHFQPNRSDLAILKRLDFNNLITVGGRRNHITNAPDIICRNPGCDRHNQRTIFRFAAAAPPIPVNDADDFWHEFQGGYVDFIFGFCYYCGTIIAFNVA